jgi:hypothetical protein
LAFLTEKPGYCNIHIQRTVFCIFLVWVLWIGYRLCMEWKIYKSLYDFSSFFSRFGLLHVAVCFHFYNPSLNWPWQET